MAREEKRDSELDKESQNRLEKLAREWENPRSAHSPDGFWGSDLRLLIEHFQPVQELLRRVVFAVVESTPVNRPANAEAALPPLAEGLTAVAQSEKQPALSQCSQLIDKCRRAERELSQCNSMVKQLEQEEKDQKQDAKKLEKQLRKVERDLSDCKASQASTPQVLTLLRNDSELARQMGLAGLPADDVGALIRTVAVLAQRDNLERLWSILKDRCEKDQRPASAVEFDLLSTALDWHNYNWPTRPFRLIEAVTASAYHYETHLRSRHNNRGETVAEQYLPGIADGGGHILCKALVDTR